MAKFPEIYKHPEWQKCRRVVIVRSNGLCERCKPKGKIVKGKEIHHVIWLTEENKNDWNIAFNPDNLINLCSDCHGDEHERSIGLQKFMEPI